MAFPTQQGAETGADAAAAAAMGLDPNDPNAAMMQQMMAMYMMMMGGMGAAGSAVPGMAGGTNNQAFSPGDWHCAKCGDHQFARNVTCRKCGAPKSEMPVAGLEMAAGTVADQTDEAASKPARERSRSPRR